MEAAFAVVGVCLSNSLYFSTLPKMRTVFSEKSLNNFNPMPIIVMALNATAWVWYGLHVPDYAIVYGNAPGALLCAWYIFNLFPLIEDPADRRICQIVLWAGVIMIMGIQVCLRVLDIEKGAALQLEGLVATGYCVAMFAAPLSKIRQVIVSKDASSIYWPLTTVQVVNCLTWTVYGFVQDDVWLYGPNTAGLILGLVQVALLAIFGGCRRSSSLLPMEVGSPDGGRVTI
mmetsp:Transcript_50986/g.75662  ORF Transcript_50986/g.75662 Transcript_50986/m.75662 type:complete len:230 (+) Transcript_50986:103-792(+)